MAQGLYEITLRKKFAKMNELTGAIMLSLGVHVRVLDKSLVNSLEWTMVWEYDPMIILLDKGLIESTQSSKHVLR